MVVAGTTNKLIGIISENDHNYNLEIIKYSPAPRD